MDLFTATARQCSGVCNQEPHSPCSFPGWLTPDPGKLHEDLPGTCLSSIASWHELTNATEDPSDTFSAELRFVVCLARPPILSHFPKMKKGCLGGVMVLEVRQAPQHSPQSELARELTLTWRSAVPEE